MKVWISRRSLPVQNVVDYRPGSFPSIDAGKTLSSGKKKNRQAISFSLRFLMKINLNAEICVSP